MQKSNFNILRTSTIALTAVLLMLGTACDREAQPGDQQPGAQPPTSADNAPQGQPEDPSSMEARTAALEKAKEEAAAKEARQPAAAGTERDQPSAKNQPYAPPREKGTDGTFSDEELEQFVEVAPKISSLEKKFRKKIGEAESAEEAKKFQQEARGKMKKVFETTELDPNQYAAIAKKMSTDPSFRDRIEKVAQ